MLLRFAVRHIGKFSVCLLKIELQITDIFYFYLLRQNQNLMQNCENVIKECEDDINFSILNYIFTILH